MLNSPHLQKALQLVRESLHDAKRKDQVTPLYRHAERVVQNLLLLGCTDIDILVAGALHDLEEDLSRWRGQPVRISAIDEIGGSRVRALVDHQQEKRFDHVVDVDRNGERLLRYAEILGRIPYWEVDSCYINLCDIAANLVRDDGILDPFCPDVYHQFHITYSVPALLQRLRALDTALEHDVLNQLFGQAWPLIATIDTDG